MKYKTLKELRDSYDKAPQTENLNKAIKIAKEKLFNKKEV
jgi:hypothetical protein